jgi:hypothetical protein
VAAISGRRLKIVLAVLSLAALGMGLSFTPSRLQRVHAGVESGGKSTEGETARQVTAFAILAIPNSATVDPRLTANVKAQLRKILPDHGFKLLDVQSKLIDVDQAVTCDLGKGYTAETILVRSLDENGKVQLRCKVALAKVAQFSTLVKTPANQLFFYERSLKDGSRVLIGVGAR